MVSRYFSFFFLGSALQMGTHNTYKVGVRAIGQQKWKYTLNAALTCAEGHTIALVCKPALINYKDSINKIKK